MDEVAGYSYSEIRPEIYSEALRNEEFNDLVVTDTSFALISVALVYLYFVIHLWSIFLASMGMLIILLSFGVTALISEGIFQVTYYSPLNSLILFIVLGIAADDFFVFNDAWRQSATFKELRCIDDDDDERKMKTLKKRMSYTFKRASKAMFVTSSTTCVAFLANYFSPIMPIKAFGIFAAIIIPVNYLMVCWIFPALIIFED